MSRAAVTHYLFPAGHCIPAWIIHRARRLEAKQRAVGQRWTTEDHRLGLESRVTWVYAQYDGGVFNRRVHKGICGSRGVGQEASNICIGYVRRHTALTGSFSVSKRGANCDVGTRGLMVWPPCSRFSFGCIVDFAVATCSDAGNSDETQLVDRLKVSLRAGRVLFLVW